MAGAAASDPLALTASIPAMAGTPETETTGQWFPLRERRFRRPGEVLQDLPRGHRRGHGGVVKDHPRTYATLRPAPAPRQRSILPAPPPFSFFRPQRHANAMASDTKPNSVIPSTIPRGGPPDKQSALTRRVRL